MADLVFASHRLVNILPRFGISFGFADRSVSQVCAQYGIDATLFLQICNLYANPDYSPEPVSMPTARNISRIGTLKRLESLLEKTPSSSTTATIAKN